MPEALEQHELLFNRVVDKIFSELLEAEETKLEALQLRA